MCKTYLEIHGNRFENLFHALKEVLKVKTMK